MGESAGACSVMYHMVSPKSRGLFHGAIAMSGDSLTPWSFQIHPRNVANDISMHMGLSMENTTAFVKTLRKMDSQQLMYGQILPVLIVSTITDTVNFLNCNISLFYKTVNVCPQCYKLVIKC